MDVKKYKFEVGDIICPNMPEFSDVEDIILSIDQDEEIVTIMRLKTGVNEAPAHRLGKLVNIQTYELQENAKLVRKATQAEMVLYGEV